MRKSEFNHIINLNFYDYETHYFIKWWNRKLFYFKKSIRKTR